MVPNPFRRNEPCSPALEHARWELRLDRSRSGRDYLAMGLEDARCQVRPSEALRGGERRHAPLGLLWSFKLSLAAPFFGVPGLIILKL